MYADGVSRSFIVYLQAIKGFYEVPQAWELLNGPNAGILIAKISGLSIYQTALKRQKASFCSSHRTISALPRRK